MPTEKEEEKGEKERALKLQLTELVSKLEKIVIKKQAEEKEQPQKEERYKKITALFSKIKRLEIIDKPTEDDIKELYTAVISIDETDPNQVPYAAAIPVETLVDVAAVAKSSKKDIVSGSEIAGEAEIADDADELFSDIKSTVVGLANEQNILEKNLKEKLASWKKDSSDGFFAARPTKFTDEIDPKVDALRQAMESGNDYLVKIHIKELNESLEGSNVSLGQESKTRQEAFNALKQLVIDTAQKFKNTKPTAVDKLFLELNNWSQASSVYGSIRPAVFKNIDIKIKQLHSVIKSKDNEKIITYASLLLADVREIERNSLASKREIACRKLEDKLQEALSELISLPPVNSDSNKASDTVSVERSPLLKSFDRLVQVNIQSKALKELREITNTWGKGLNIFKRLFGIKRSDFFTTKIFQCLFGSKQRPDIFVQPITYTYENQIKSKSIDSLIETINKAFEKENFGAIQPIIAQLILAINTMPEGDPTLPERYAAENEKLSQLLKLCNDIVSPSIPDSSPKKEEVAVPQKSANEQAPVPQPASSPKIEPDTPAEQPKPAIETTPEPQHVCPDVKVVASLPDSSPKKEEVSAEQQPADEQASVPQPAPSPKIELDITSNVPTEQSPVPIKKSTCKQGSYAALTVFTPVVRTPSTILPPKANTPGPSFFKGSPPPSAPPSPNLQALSKEMPVCTLVLKKGTPPNQQESSKESLAHQATTFSVTSC